jgi:molecular chaperone DnaK (HSP70)
MPILCCFASLAACVHLGIDFGSQFVKAAIVETTDHPQVAPNFEGQRLTPAFIGFRATPSFNLSGFGPLLAEEAVHLSPVFGRKALDLMVSRPWGGTGFLALFLDRTPEESESLARALFVNTSAARIPISDLTTTFFKLFVDSVVNGKVVNSVTVAVPAVFTVPQRRLVEGAVRGAGFKYLASVDDADAVSNAYAIRKFQKFANGTHTVLFVDVGAASVKAYAIRFAIVRNEKTQTGQATAERLSYEIAEKQGGAFLTARIVEVIKKKLGIESLTPSDGRRLFDAAEKLKIRLTLAQTAEITIEDIGDEDRGVSLSREELNELAAELIASTIATAKSAAEGVLFDDLEIIGGSSRIPFLQSSLQAAFGLESIGHSLNSDEAVASGAGYHAQFRAGTSRYQRVLLNNSFPVHTMSLAAGNATWEISSRGGNFTDELSIEGKVETVTFEYGSTSLRTTQFGYRVDNMTENATLELRLTRSPVDINSARACAEKRFCSHIAMLPLVPIFGAPPVHLVLMKGEASRKRLGVTRNSAEQLALRVLDELEHNETVINFTNELQRFKIRTTAEEVKAWIREYGDEGTEKDFATRFNSIRDLIVPVYTRIFENRTLSIGIMRMFQVLYRGRLEVLEWAVNRTWINRSTIDNFTRLVSETEQWLSTTITPWKELPLWEPRGVKIDDFENRTRAVMEELKRIGSIRPTPSQKVLSPVRKTMDWMSGWFKPRAKKPPAANQTASSPLSKTWNWMTSLFKPPAANEKSEL